MTFVLICGRMKITSTLVNYGLFVEDTVSDFTCALCGLWPFKGVCQDKVASSGDLDILYLKGKHEIIAYIQG